MWNHRKEEMTELFGFPELRQSWEFRKAEGSRSYHRLTKSNQLHKEKSGELQRIPHEYTVEY
jgi:hypothetical protein